MPDLYSGSFHILVEFHRKKLTLLICRVISRFFFSFSASLLSAMFMDKPNFCQVIQLSHTNVRTGT